MTVRIAIELADRLIGEAAATPVVEVCGLLFGTDRHIVSAQSCTNVARSPGDSFEIDPVALIAAHRRGRAGGPMVIGCYHSHPHGEARPSPRDATAAAPDGGLWLIVAGGTVAAWRAKPDSEIYDDIVHGRFVMVPLSITKA